MRRLACVLFQSGHVEDDHVVHLTHTTLMVEAICGELITHHGAPHEPVACESCLEIVVELGLDVTEWYCVRPEAPTPVELRPAA